MEHAHRSTEGRWIRSGTSRSIPRRPRGKHEPVLPLARKAKGATEIVRKRKREVAESVYYLESLEGQLEDARHAGRRDRRAAGAFFLLPSRAKPAGKKEGARKDAPRPVLPQVREGRVSRLRDPWCWAQQRRERQDREELSAPDDPVAHAQGNSGKPCAGEAPCGKRGSAGEKLIEGGGTAGRFSTAKDEGGPRNIPVSSR